VSIKRFLTFIIVLGLLVPIFSVEAQQNGGDLGQAVSWLKDQQQADGGFSNGFAPESDLGTTADAILAFFFAGEDPNLLKMEDQSPVDFLQARVQSGDVQGAGVAAKIVLALNAAGLDPRSFASQDLVEAILKDHDDVTGLFGFGPFDSALAISALMATGVDLPAGAIDGLLSTRLEDGSFSFSADPGQITGDSNTTALVVQALIAAGAEDEIGPSLDYFRSTQNEDSGWTYQKPSEYGVETDANSTALVIQALDAAGEDLEEWGDPMAALASLQLESGAFGLNATFPDANILATIQAIPTLAGGTYVEPVAPSPDQDSLMPKIVIGTTILIILLIAGAFFGARMRSRASDGGEVLER
jgi:hypothetical protein